MNRRFFILSAATVGVGLPVAYYIKEKHLLKKSNPLAVPGLLSSFCSEFMLKKIGANYLAQMPGENAVKTLQNLLLTDVTGKKINQKNEAAIADLMEKKMNEDFLHDNTFIINGWVISQTEARQCALFSLS